MVTVLVDDGQTPFEMVHENKFVPTPKLLTVVVGDAGEEIVPLPESSDQAPVPMLLGFPASVALEEHICWLLPALAVVGVASTVIVTVLAEEGHVPLLMVQVKMFCPMFSPVAAEL